MKSPRFSSQFARLGRPSIHAHIAGRYAACRDHWMDEARYGRPELKPLHVSFARNSHHAFMRSLRQALESNT